MWKQLGFFDQRNYIKESTWKQLGFFDQQNCMGKSTWNQRRFFSQRNYIEKVRENGVEVRRNLIFNVSTQYRRGFDLVCPLGS